MTTDFTPVTSALGGMMIGLAALLLMAFFGRIFGATGILAGLVLPERRDEMGWRAMLILGMVAAPGLYWVLTGAMPVIELPVSRGAIVIGGLLVGIGVTLGSGCTSGHGVCGLARLSPRSGVAVASFMATGFATYFLLHHVMGG